MMAEGRGIAPRCATEARSWRGKGILALLQVWFLPWIAKVFFAPVCMVASQR